MVSTSVRRQETAVSELVKNSYDADATCVKLTFINSNETGGTLVIEDSGVGMTKEQLINGFMRISSTDKVRHPYSDLYNRKRAGKKGIGRFAVQRLGRNLSIITKSINEDSAYKLSIDWDKYVGEKNLTDITNTIENINSDKTFGTTLRIENLRDKWTEAAIKRIYRYVSDIMQPFPLSKNNNAEGQDPGSTLLKLRRRIMFADATPRLRIVASWSLSSMMTLALLVYVSGVR